MSTTPVSEAELRAILVLRAAETGPPDALWSENDQADATREALAMPSINTMDSRHFIATRARLAAPKLLARDPSLARAVQLLTWRDWVGPVVIIAALLLGGFSNSLGSARNINLLAPPLIGVLIWNLVVYAAMAADGIGSFLPKRPDVRGPIGRAMGRLAHGLPPVERQPGRAQRFSDHWVNATHRLTGARVATILHAAAATLAAGALSALYLKGVAFEYLAGWESTFLDAQSVANLLHLILGPASLLSGIALPDAEGIARIGFKAGGGGENAARWIHLYAITLLLFVVLPRSLLAVVAARRRRQLAADCPTDFDEPYYDGLVRGLRGESAQLLVVPYSIRLNESQAAALQRCLQRVQGASSTITIAPTVAFGAEDGFRLKSLVEADNASATAMITIVFPLTATPERENHGEFVVVLRDQTPDTSQVLVLVDESGFVARFSGQHDRRDQRRTAWRRSLATINCHPVFVNLGDDETESNVAAVREALSRLKTEAAMAPLAFAGLAVHNATTTLPGANDADLA